MRSASRNPESVKQEIRDRLRRWREFNRWEQSQPPVDRPAAELIADIGAIREWLPPDVRIADPDPGKRGIQTMRAALSRLRVAL